ncbi:MAG: hypothetical protein R3Y04_03220, partial [Rikenellaceae bacterium]
YSISWHEEIMLYNEDYDYGYVYSISSGAWYSRTISGKRLSYTQLVIPTGILNLASREDQSSPLAPSLITNAICFNSSALTKIEYLSPIFKASKNSIIEIIVYCSNDCVNWYKVARALLGKRLGRFGASWRYFRIELNYIETSTTSQYSFVLTALEFKYTVRYRYIID